MRDELFPFENYADLVEEHFPCFQTYQNKNSDIWTWDICIVSLVLLKNNPVTLWTVEEGSKVGLGPNLVCLIIIKY